MYRIKTVILVALLMFLVGGAVSKLSKNTYAQDIRNIIDKQVSCGTIEQACCKGDINLPTPQIPSPNIPLIKDAISIATTLPNLMIKAGWIPLKPLIERGFSVFFEGGQCAEGTPSSRNNLSTCVCTKEPLFNIAALCSGISNPTEKEDCRDCSSHGVWTSIGCADFNLGTFIRERLFGFGIGLAGVAALLCIIYSAFILQTSRGNPERIKKARESLTACIMGLLLIIFSIFILRLIGVDILRIPGFL